MNEAISWSFGELEGVLSGVHRIDQSKRTAFQARLKNFHRLRYPIGFSATKGKAATYTPLQIIDMALAVEMTQLGLPPERATWVLSRNRWPTLMAIKMAAAELVRHPAGFDPEKNLRDDPFSMFLYFDPAALNPLTLDLQSRTNPDMDEAAYSFFYGGIGIVRENIAAWTSGFAPRISLINVTAMIGLVVWSPFDEDSREHVTYRQGFFRQLEADADRAQSEWEGGSDEAEEDYVLGLLEREEITDSGKLGERVSIPAERAARYITENTARIARRNHDGNT